MKENMYERKNVSSIKEKLDYIFIKKILDEKEYIVESIRKILNSDYFYQDILQCEVKKYNLKYLGKLTLFLRKIEDYLIEDKLKEIFLDDIDIIRLGTRLKTFLLILSNLGIDYDKELYNTSKLIEIYGRDGLNNFQNKKQIYYGDCFNNFNVYNSKLEEEITVYHPENNIFDLTLDFLDTLLKNKDIDTIYINSYGIVIFDGEKKNLVYEKIIEISKEKKLYFIFDPILKFDNEKLNNEIAELKKDGIDVIIPNRKTHGKIIIGLSSKKGVIHYMKSSGNFIRPRVQDGSYSKEDISVFGKTFFNTEKGKNFLEIFSFLLNKGIKKPKINNSFLISPFNAKKELINYIKKEEEEIYIATNVFYDLEILDSLIEKAKRGVKVSIIVRDGKNIFLPKIHSNISIYKRKQKGITNQQHSRMYYFKSLNRLFTGSLGCDTYRFNESFEMLFPTEIKDNFYDLMCLQKQESKKII